MFKAEIDESKRSLFLSYDFILFIYKILQTIIFTVLPRHLSLKFAYFDSQEATAMNPDMTVEKIEIQQQSTQP